MPKLVVMWRRREAPIAPEGSPSRRLIIVCAPPLPGLGGIESFTNAIVHEAKRLGYEPTLISTARRHEPFISTYLTAPIYRIRALQFFSGRLPLPISPIELVRVVADVFAMRDRTVVVIQARFYPTSLFFAAIAHVFGHSCAIIDHGAEFITLHNRFLDILSITYERAITWGERLFRPKFYGVSKSSVAWLRRLGIENAAIVSNGVDASLLTVPQPPRDSVTTVLFCGRLIKQKGILELIDGFDLWTRRCQTQGRLLVIGDGPLSTFVSDRLRKFKNASFIGRVTHEEALRWIASADIVVSPSTWPEGFCTVALEAGALGRALLATPYGGAEDLIDDGLTGKLLINVRAETIATELENLASQPELRSQLGGTLRERVAKEYLWQSILENFLSNLHASQNDQLRPFPASVDR